MLTLNQIVKIASRSYTVAQVTDHDNGRRSYILQNGKTYYGMSMMLKNPGVWCVSTVAGQGRYFTVTENGTFTQISRPTRAA